MRCLHALFLESGSETALELREDMGVQRLQEPRRASGNQDYMYSQASSVTQDMRIGVRAAGVEYQDQYLSLIHI